MSDVTADSQALSVSPTPVDDLPAQLSPEQHAAMRCLLAGITISDAAQVCKVGRRTLYRWLKDDDVFASVFNLWKREQLESARAQALSMTGSAMKTIGSAIEKGNVSAALQVARGLGVLQPPAPGDTDAELLSRKRKIAAARRNARLYKAEQSYSVKRFREIETVAQCEEHLKFWGGLRDDFLRRDMDAWMGYNYVMRMSDEECQRKDIVKPANPPSCPCPTAQAVRDMLRRNPDSGILRNDVKRYLAWRGESISEADSQPPGNEITSPDNAGGAQPEASSSPPPDDGESSAPPAVKSATAPASTTVQTHATRVLPTPAKAARKAPEPYVEPDDDPWVRYS